MTIHAPVPDYSAARRSMIESQLRPQGVTDHAVLEAMGEIPREAFVPAEARPLAYSDRSVAIGGDRFLSAPAVLGQLLTQMAPVAGENALVIGAGSGYSAAVLARIGLRVVAVESDAVLAASARALGVEIAEGFLDGGHEAGAPYQFILIDGAVDHIPEALVEQLADGGRLGAALSSEGVTRLIIGRKAGGAFGYFSVGDAAVAPLPGFVRPRTFQF